MADVVLAGYVTVETAVPGGRAWVDVPRGSMLPDDVPYELLAQLRAAGKVGRADPPPTDVDPAIEEEFAFGSTIEKTLAWVGNDVDKARQALTAETSDGGKNRPRLIAQLEQILTGA